MGNGWNRLPVVLQRYVMGYLNDPILFRLRVLNKFFYLSYYNQYVRKGSKFNFRRALFLVKNDRIFKNVTHFSFGDWFKSFKLPRSNRHFFRPSAFPKLTSMSFDGPLFDAYNFFKMIPACPGLTHIEIDADANLLQNEF